MRAWHVEVIEKIKTISSHLSNIKEATLVYKGFENKCLLTEQLQVDVK